MTWIISFVVRADRDRFAVRTARVKLDERRTPERRTTACVWLAACYHPGHEIQGRSRSLLWRGTADPSGDRCGAFSAGDSGIRRPELREAQRCFRSAAPVRRREED